jgi:glycosyltransferase involved in cell wall biosynthesis
MNKGFEMATGDIISYLNADDFYYSGAFEHVITAFNKGAIFVVGDIDIVSARLLTTVKNTPRITLKGMLRHWEPNAFCHNPVGYFYKKEVQRECPFNIENECTMDLEFLLDAAAKYPFTKVDQTLGCYMDDLGTKTHESQLQNEYWVVETFPYIDSHLQRYDSAFRKRFNEDRLEGYEAMRQHMLNLEQQRENPDG